jgi:hypothetical protein
MSQQIENIDSKRARTISEFLLEYENDEEITKPDAAQRARLFIGVLDDDVIVSSQSRNTGEIWGNIAIEKRNINFVAESIEKLLGAEKPWETPIEYENGKDRLLIYYGSSWAHNLPAPFERINVRNRRNYEMDGLRSIDVEMELPPRMAQKFAEQIKKLFLQEE